MTSKNKKVYVERDYGFVGWRGQSIRLNAGDVYDLDSDIVQDLPDMFTSAPPGEEGKADEAKVEKPAPKRGRRG